MKKLKCYIDFEKEEKWLNQMAKQGWELDGHLFAYSFHKTNACDAIIKIDYRTFKNKSDFEDYVTLFRDSGWEHIAGSKYSGTQYFKRVDENSDTDIFSDVPSKAARYKRLSAMWLMTAVSYLPILVALMMTRAIDASAFLNPKALFYTPGLWEKTGASFWGAFLFETPFALMRGFSWYLFAALIILYFVFAIRAEMLYRNTKAQ